jgi:hypothetical protein
MMFAEASAALFCQLGDHRGRALALARLAFARHMDGAPQAHSLSAEACALAQVADDPWLIGFTHSNAAQITLFGAGDTTAASRDPITPITHITAR